MSGPQPEIEASDAMLAEAAKGDLVLMRHVRELALATDDPAEVGTLVHAYARVSRAMRQNLALLAKQKADRARAAREAEKHAADLEAGRLLADDEARKTPEEIAWEARADHLVEAMGRVISHAAAGDKARHTELAHRFDRELDDWYEADDFLDPDPETHVRRACRALGLPEALGDRWQDLPEPTFFPDPAPRPDDSSADAGPSFDPPASDRPPTDPAAPPPPWANSG